MPKLNERLTPEDLAAYLEGEVTPSEATRVERELRDSSSARRQLNTLQHIRDALVNPISEFEQIDLVPSLRVRMTHASAVPTERRRFRWQTIMPWAVAAASVLLVLGLGRQYDFFRQTQTQPVAARVGQTGASLGEPASDPEFRAKSVDSDPDPARWTALQIYRVHQGGRPERVQKTLAHGDGLLFSYTNLGRAPSEYLMIFALDARGQVRWFHPAYVRAGENPESIPIRTGEADVPLPDLIRHDLAPGRLEFHALFSSRPLSVLAVEAAVSSRSPGKQLTLPNVVDQMLTVQVEP